MCDTKNRFCYICGLVATPPKGNKTRIDRFRLPWIAEAYSAYFSRPFHERNSWTPDSLCRPCHSALNNWYHRMQLVRWYKSPVVWCNPYSHDAECFFCNSNTVGLTKANRNKPQHYFFRVETAVEGGKKVVQNAESSASIAIRFGAGEPNREFPPLKEVHPPQPLKQEQNTTEQSESTKRKRIRK